MAKIKFHFNTETLNYEPIIQSFAHKLKTSAHPSFFGSIIELYFSYFRFHFAILLRKQLGVEKSYAGSI